MTLKIFLTGATGYIGGDILYQLYQSHPDFEYALLIRTEDKAKTVLSNYPKARIVIGDTANSSGHDGAAKAISKGLVQGHSTSRPGFWLHTDIWEVDDKVLNDLDGIDELVNLPAAAFHRNVDKIALDTGINHDDAVKTAIIAPPTIYGQGRGPASNRGRQVYELASFILKEQYCLRIGKVLSRWNNVHVPDLSMVFELLMSTAVGQEAFKQGLIKGGPPELCHLSIDEAVNSSAGFEAGSWGMNSRGVAARTKKVLGWKPQERSLYDELPDIVQSEASRMDL
ncbi:hypothetical protein BDW74DRAFT_168608 [Aspergillus multicolor]|uniref:uncharacterized protein n=1 Tax=Aspergillus multicolor TaxID=41759 RepID=UPI003CCD4C88